MGKYNVLFFNFQGLHYGSIDKFMQLLAANLCHEFNIYYAYNPRYGEQQKHLFDGLPITLVPFSHDGMESREPYRYINMHPTLGEIIKQCQPHCIYAQVFAHYQFPINVIPASIPLILLSPFGHFATNGAVEKIFVSGKSNYDRVKKRAGEAITARDLHPFADFAPEFLIKPPVGNQVVFGRLGRPDENNFDPIAVKAFKKLEEKYGDGVKYIVVSPSEGWKKLAKELGIKNMEYHQDPPRSYLPEFEQKIDVFAHARKDGETVGYAIAESMMAGNPIITHRSHFHNDQFDILSPAFARWCEPDDYEAYYNNMAWFVEHKDQIRPMGQLARQRALELFSVKEQMPFYKEVFLSACKKCTHYSRLGRVKGYIRLYWENLKSVPFLVGKMFARQFPALEGRARKIYRQL